ncbi:hypothetical protein FACS1894139_04790 [Planctomycetales bacterium]|nr:hypothetical protein FACS1894107_03470 [Planctomycetales bacterium]GHS96967.1 hypothetical protein FACS1894108_02530 [Planctomycetales bacterium]GHT03754.1 hypothetical protein FACS1894139_04790 [Planctomycetales bacterium]
MRSFKSLWLQRATARGWKLLSAVALTAGMMFATAESAKADDLSDAITNIFAANPSMPVDKLLDMFMEYDSVPNKIAKAKVLVPGFDAEWDSVGAALSAAFSGKTEDDFNAFAKTITDAGGGVAGLIAFVAAADNPEAAKELLQGIITSGVGGDPVGSEAAAASAELTLNSVQQFNSAIAQQFGDSAIHNVVLNSLAGGRASAGGATGSGDRGLVGFVKAYGGFGSQDNTARNGRKITGSDFGGVGVATGVGYKLSQELELGALIGYSWNHTESKTPTGGNFSLGEITDNTLRLGLYGNFTWDNLFVTSSPTFGIHLLNGERAVSATQKAKNDRTGFDFSWFNRAGYTFALPAEFFITPSYALGMTYLHDPAHSEYGVPAAAAVKYHDYDNWSLLQTLDLRVGRLFRVNDCFALLPEIWGGWEHEYLDPNSVTTTMGAGALDYTAQYRVPGIAQDRAVLGVGLTTIIQNKYEVFGRYDERLWDGGHLSQFSVGLSVKF